MLKRTFASVVALAAAAGTAVTLSGATPAVANPEAENISTAQQCVSVDSVQIVINWTEYNTGDQWLDVSLYNNGWAPGTFFGLGPMPSNQDAVMGQGLEPGEQHYIRINTLTAEGWAPSETYAVFSPDCSVAQPAVLLVPEPPVPGPEPSVPAQLPAPLPPTQPAPAPLPTTPPPPGPGTSSNGY